MENRLLSENENFFSDPIVEDWLKNLSSRYSKDNLQKIRKAYEFSKKAHQGQIRKSGEPYISHPFGVAQILSDLNLDSKSIIVGLLHDTVEDTKSTLEDIEREFDSSVARLVDGVTKISQINFLHFRQKQGENIRKMILAMGQDVRVVLVKIADRLHNMRTLHYVPYEKQERIAQETSDIYVPLSGRLGMGSIKLELEDLSFRFLKPHQYYDLVEKVNTQKEDREKHIEKTKAHMSRKLKESIRFPFEVSGRFKSFYSIYKKMELKNISYHQLYDLVAFRVCVNTVSECYEVLGLIHSFYTPVPGRFKDFIAMPKSNQYQSLHTTVIGASGGRIEVQIRTHKMHQVAEWGIAAHWKYKTQGPLSSSSSEDKSINKFNWYRELISMHQGTENPEDVEEFLESVKINLAESEIYVFTPKGEVREFPEGATPIDFAYSIHTDIGNSISSARVNGKVVPLRSVLKNGDTVEVITSKNRLPSKDWLKHCVTTKAKSRIRYFIKTEERKEALEVGRDLLNQSFNKLQLTLEEHLKGEKFEKFKISHGCVSLDELYIRLGYGKISCQKVIDFLVPKEKREEIIQKNPPVKPADPLEKEDLFFPLSSPSKTQQTGKKTSSSSMITVDGMNHLMVRYARCCHPILGDDIVGFITYGRGISIHRKSCQKVLEMDSDRRVNVTWNASSKNPIKSKVLIRVICTNERGLLKSMSEVISAHNVDINGANIQTTQDETADCIFDVSLRDAKQLNQVMFSLRKLKKIHSVSRVTPSSLKS